MAIELFVASPFSSRVHKEELRKIARRALREEKVSSRQSVTIVITDNGRIRSLNREFHHADATTDVLSFPSDTEGYLGDIVISYETARENARKAGWRIRDELKLLVVHGVLHLVGYDDTRPRARARMWQRQHEILRMDVPV